jgi:hypothetical protein
MKALEFILLALAIILSMRSMQEFVLSVALKVDAETPWMGSIACALWAAYITFF